MKHTLGVIALSALCGAVLGAGLMMIAIWRGGPPAPEQPAMVPYPQAWEVDQ